MRRPSTRALVVVGVLVALALAGIVSFYASSSPDGLNRVAEDQGISRTQRHHQAAGGPLAGYRAKGVADDRLATGVAGVTGALVVLGLFGGLTLVLRHRKQVDATQHGAGDQRAGDHADGADV